MTGGGAEPGAPVGGMLSDGISSPAFGEITIANEPPGAPVYDPVQEGYEGLGTLAVMAYINSREGEASVWDDTIGRQIYNYVANPFRTTLHALATELGHRPLPLIGIMVLKMPSIRPGFRLGPHSGPIRGFSPRLWTNGVHSLQKAPTIWQKLYNGYVSIASGVQNAIDSVGGAVFGSDKWQGFKQTVKGVYDNPAVQAALLFINPGTVLAKGLLLAIKGLGLLAKGLGIAGKLGGLAKGLGIFGGIRNLERAGRWMNAVELERTLRTGTLLPPLYGDSLNVLKYVIKPGQGKPRGGVGNHYIEFDIFEGLIEWKKNGEGFIRFKYEDPRGIPISNIEQIH